MADVVYIEIDEVALKDAVNQAEGVSALVEQKASEIADRANSYGASFETERTVVWATGERVGGTSPEYGHSVKVTNQGAIGLVMPKNYAAMKDNYLHNTLLKAKG